MTDSKNGSESNPESSLLRRLLPRARALMGTTAFETFIIGLILINAVGIGLSASSIGDGPAGPALRLIDDVILGIFVCELVMRWLVHGRKLFKEAWSWFDLFVIAGSLISTGSESSVVRTFRVLRVMRLLRFVPSLRRVTQGLLSSLPGVGSVIALMLIVFYVFSVISTQLYGDQFPEWFGSLGASAFTLFQIMTLESWAMGIVRPVMQEFPNAWLFFVVFVMVSSFTVLNLIIGVFVSAMQDADARERSQERELEREKIKEELAREHEGVTELIDALRNDIKQLRSEVAESKKRTP